VLSVSEKKVDSEPVIMYSTGVLVGDSIFFVPKVASFIGVLHLLQVPCVVLLWNDDAVANWENDGSVKYSAAVLVDNAVYFVTLSANNVGVLDVSNAQPQFAKLTLDGQLQGPQKFSNGVHVNGRIYLVPFLSSHIGVLNIRSPNTIQYSSLVFENMPVSETKWSGGVLADNGKIYFAPYSLTDVGIFDPSTLLFTIAPSRYGILSVDRMNFGGGILGANGKIHFPPYLLSEMHEFDYPQPNVITTGNIFCHECGF